MALTDQIQELHTEWAALQEEYEGIVFVSTEGERAFERSEITDEQYRRTKEITARQREIVKLVSESLNRRADDYEKATEPSQYPEHEKMRAVQERSQAIGLFIDWLGSQGIVLCKADPNYMGDRSPYWPQRKRIEELLAEHFEIDLDKIEEEKRAILDGLRASQEKAS